MHSPKPKTHSPSTHSPKKHNERVPQKKKSLSPNHSRSPPKKPKVDHHYHDAPPLLCLKPTAHVVEKSPNWVHLREETRKKLDIRNLHYKYGFNFEGRHDTVNLFTPVKTWMTSFIKKGASLLKNKHLFIALKQMKVSSTGKIFNLHHDAGNLLESDLFVFITYAGVDKEFEHVASTTHIFPNVTLNAYGSSYMKLPANMRVLYCKNKPGMMSIFPAKTLHAVGDTFMFPRIAASFLVKIQGASWHEVYEAFSSLGKVYSCLSTSAGNLARDARVRNAERNTRYETTGVYEDAATHRAYLERKKAYDRGQ